MSGGTKRSLRQWTFRLCRKAPAWSEAQTIHNPVRPWINSPLYHRLPGVTHSAISRPASISARRSSQVFCRFSHSCGVIPKYLASRNAVSALTPRWLFRIIVIRFTGTPSSFDNALADNPSVSSSSRSISPGCTGLIPFLAFISLLTQW